MDWNYVSWVLIVKILPSYFMPLWNVVICEWNEGKMQYSCFHYNVLENCIFEQSLFKTCWQVLGFDFSFWRNCNLLGLNYDDSKILQLPWILLFPLAVFLPLLHLFFASNSSALLLMNWIKTFTSKNYGVQLCTPFADSRFFPSVYAFHTDCCCHWKNKLNKTGTWLTGETSSKQAKEW